MYCSIFNLGYTVLVLSLIETDVSVVLGNWLQVINFFSAIAGINPRFGLSNAMFPVKFAKSR